MHLLYTWRGRGKWHRTDLNLGTHSRKTCLPLRLYELNRWDTGGVINGKRQARAMDADGRSGGAPARKVMVVADPTRESAAALEYALYHAVLEKDDLTLLHVDNVNSWRNSFATFLKRQPSTSHGTTPAPPAEGHGGQGNSDFLEEMKKACKIAQPKMHVQIVKVELEGNNNKGATILSQANSMFIDLLIVGQRQSLSAAILGSRRNSGGSKAQGTADFLIDNCKCTCVAVQRKGQKAGYLLNTKTQRNFWLLA
uniref:UspA domain-containing protein n=1 Tax=Kalanchoe fedtschenkoi TaxID=63787 RepID=A0A7N0USG5_KALFE